MLYGGLAVETMGNTPITSDALRNYLDEVLLLNSQCILVIGSNSFSGSHFVAEALQDGHRVWGLVALMN